MFKTTLLAAIAALTLGLTACSTTAPSSTEPAATATAPVTQQTTVQSSDPQNGYQADEQDIQDQSYE